METKPLTADAYRHALALRDLTDPAHGPHAMQLLAAEVVQSLREAWDCDVLVHRASPVVSLEDNYDRLGYPADAAARDARYTRYVGPRSVLRTHASAMIPGLLRMIAAAEYADVLLVCLGLVYRRDRIERLSVGEPHQLDLWRISRAPLGDLNLRQMIDRVMAAGLPSANTERFRHHTRTRCKGSKSRCAKTLAGSRSQSAASPPPGFFATAGFQRITTDSRWGSALIGY